MATNITSIYPLSSQLILATILPPTLLLATCGNGLLCVLVCQKSTMRTHPNNIMLASLSCADTLMALLCAPVDFLVVLDDGGWWPNDVICRIQAFIFVLLGGAASYSLMLISLDRYTGQGPDVTMTATSLRLVTGWVLCAGLTVPLLLGWPGSLTSQARCRMRYATSRLQVIYVCTLFVLLWMLPSMATLTSQALLLAGLRRGGRVAAANGGRIILLARSGELQTRTLITVLILTVTFALFRWPYVINAYLEHLGGHRGHSMTTSNLLWWSYAGLAIDPLIFLWRIRRFRSACINVTTRCCWWCCWSRGCHAVVRRHQRTVCPSAIYRTKDVVTSWPGSRVVVDRY